MYLLRHSLSLPRLIQSPTWKLLPSFITKRLLSDPCRLTSRRVASRRVPLRRPPFPRFPALKDRLHLQGYRPPDRYIYLRSQPNPPTPTLSHLRLATRPILFSTTRRDAPTALGHCDVKYLLRSMPTYFSKHPL